MHLVPPVARAAVVAGADVLMVEVHPCPEKALKDGAQSLTPDIFSTLMTELGCVRELWEGLYKDQDLTIYQSFLDL